MKAAMQKILLIALTAFIVACSSADKVDNAAVMDSKALAERVPTIMYIDFIWNGGSRAFWFPNEDGTYTFVYLDTRTKINAPKVKYVDVRRQKGLLSEGNVKPLQRFGPGEYEKIVPVIKDIYIVDIALEQLFDILVAPDDFDADRTAMAAWVISNYSPKDAGFINRLSAAPPEESKRMARQWKDETFAKKGDFSGKIIWGWDKQMLAEYFIKILESIRSKN